MGWKPITTTTITTTTNYRISSKNGNNNRNHVIVLGVTLYLNNILLENINANFFIVPQTLTFLLCL
jgi:hypothetical protein